MIYEQPKIYCFTEKQIVNCFAKTESCEVVCTYMYGYCGDKEGWGTTYCPKWSQGGK